MEKIKNVTTDVVDENIQYILERFPECATEIEKDGRICRAIDFDKLRNALSEVPLAEDLKERYQFTWPGKRDAARLACTPIEASLRPAPEESKEFDSTENLYIEGDNLDVLKVLRESYLGKVKMIYIDPPYNTGSDFVYEDDFSQAYADYKDDSGQTNEKGERFVKNLESNGRFHTDWLNMIYPRLKVARDLLTDDGVIFISIDDNEQENLRKVCDEIFGNDNFLAQFVWRGGKRNAARRISLSHEYMLLYAKSVNLIPIEQSWKIRKEGLDNIYMLVGKLRQQYGDDYETISKKLKAYYKSLSDSDPIKDNAHYCKIDERGIWFSTDISRVGGDNYDVINPITGNLVKKPKRGWAMRENVFWNLYKENRIIIKDDDSLPILKRYLHENETQLLDTVFYKDRRAASKDLDDLFSTKVFEHPKDKDVIAKFISSMTKEDSIILDFFSGSATTAHAVMQLNAEDGGNRRFIMVQLPEKTDEKSAAKKAGYDNICEIGKERIRRAGELIKKEHPDSDVDTGFRVLKLSESVKKNVEISAELFPEKYVQGSLDFDEFVDNINEDVTSLDLLFQSMNRLGVELSESIEEQIVEGKTIYNVADGYLIACFDEDVTREVITEIAKMEPSFFVMRDASAASDSVIDNFEQIFKAYSPMTVRRII